MTSDFFDFFPSLPAISVPPVDAAERSPPINHCIVVFRDQIKDHETHRMKEKFKSMRSYPGGVTFRNTLKFSC